jgi:Fur family transcriptional regulator, ferric uptake regulator
MMMENKTIERELENLEIRPTAVRLRVLGFFNKHTHAISLNELEQQLNPIDRTTLFRTIKTFQQKGILHPISEADGALKYARCADGCTCSYQDHLHIHFSCEYCGHTFCLHDVPAPNPKLPEGFIPNDASVLINGVCPNCSC